MSTWLLHISDLHLGESLAGGGLVPGLAAHGFRALEALMTSIPRVIVRPGARVLVVSGDVSASGTGPQLAMYRTLLELGFVRDAFVRFPPLRRVGERVVEVPGNHDYWNGWAMNPFFNKGLREEWFDEGSRRAVVPTGRYLVGLYSLCSTCGTTGREQMFAVGAFEDAELQSVRAQMARIRDQAGSEGLRSFDLLVTHHSPSHGYAFFRGMADRARAALEALEGLVGIMNGHAHSTRIGGVGGSSKREARCGSTTRGRACEFLVHELRDEEGKEEIQWFVTRWVFDGTRFQHLPEQRVWPAEETRKGTDP